MKRIAVFGDIGGHHDELHAALVDLGMHPDTCTLPEDLVVVQVGDLIHRGPASGQVLMLVRHILTQQPEQWVQLAGNHEGLYLPGAPEFTWHERLNNAGEDLLRTWWTQGQMRVAVGLATEYGDLLLTHAGLTVGLWRKIGAPTDVRTAVPALNALATEAPHLLWRTGRMFDGDRSNPSAGPMWAEAGSELYGPWLEVEADGDPVPFGQVHGHASAYWWAKKQWRAPHVVWSRFLPIPKRRHLVGVIGSRMFAGIDPDFGHRAHDQWAPLVFPAARVVAR